MMLASMVLVGVILVLTGIMVKIAEITEEKMK